MPTWAIGMSRCTYLNAVLMAVKIAVSRLRILAQPPPSYAAIASISDSRPTNEVKCLWPLLPFMTPIELGVVLLPPCDLGE